MDKYTTLFILGIIYFLYGIYKTDEYWIGIGIGVIASTFSLYI